MDDAKHNEEHSSTQQTPLILERIVNIKRRMQNDAASEPLYLHELGICYYSLQNRRQALQYLERLLQKYPDYIEQGAVHALRALILLELREYKIAEELLQERLRRDSLDTRLLSMLAYVYEKTARGAQAIVTLQDILRIKPDDLNSLNSLGYLLALGGKSKADKELAFNCLAKAVRARSENPAYLDSLGVYYARQGDMQRAHKALLRALRRAPYNSEILEHLRQYALAKGTA